MKFIALVRLGVLWKGAKYSHFSSLLDLSYEPKGTSDVSQGRTQRDHLGAVHPTSVGHSLSYLSHMPAKGGCCRLKAVSVWLPLLGQRVWFH